MQWQQGTRYKKSGDSEGTLEQMLQWTTELWDSDSLELISNRGQGTAVGKAELYI